MIEPSPIEAPQSATPRGRRPRRRPGAPLHLFGERGAGERGRYLAALAADLRAGHIDRDTAVDELHRDSERWMRDEVARRLRRLPPHADPQTTEHWLWMEWHRALGRFDPDQIETFPAYVALRLRMAVVAAAREDDPVPRRTRSRMRELESLENDLVQDLGRSLSPAEVGELERLVFDDTRPTPAAVPLEGGEPAPGAVGHHDDPATGLERRQLIHAVRSSLGTLPPGKRRQIVHWLDDATGHDRLPPQRLTQVPNEVRDLLRAWAD